MYYIDATGSLAKPGVRVHAVYLTATAATAVLALKDSTVAGTLVDLRNVTSGTTAEFKFDPPLTFPNGVEVSTATNCVATAIVDYNRGG
jgi:hypothetical protein